MIETALAAVPPGIAWAATGAAGAVVFFLRHAWPAIGMRARNLAVSLVAAAAAGLLTFAFPLEFPFAWRLGAAWLGTALLLQWSHDLTGAGRYLAPRVVAATAIALAGDWLILR